MLHLWRPAASPSWSPASTAKDPVGKRTLPPPPPFMVQPPPPPSPATARSLDPSQARIRRMLSSYISRIRGEEFLPRLNARLRSRGGSEKTNIRAYYASRAELRGYTLGVELDRDLAYTLVREDGEAVSDKRAIRSHFGIADGSSCDGELGSPQSSTDETELLIRAANQSLFADAFAALSGSEESLLLHNGASPRLILTGPLLSMTAAVEKCHFAIDLPRRRVEGICVLAVGVPVDEGRLVLARAILVAHFQPGRERGQLRYEVKMVKAHRSPESEVICDAAVSLARDEENIMFQGGRDDEPTE